MTRVVSFVDGYSSLTAPDIEGTVQEDYPIENNLSVFTDIDGLIFDHNLHKTVFLKAEVRRFHEVIGVPTEYVQACEMTLTYNDAWELTKGLLTGIDMLQVSDVVNDYDVALVIDSVTGQMRAKSGNMTGDDYEGNLKISITRIV